MAVLPVGSTFVIGDYEYGVNSTSPAQVRAQVVDKTKTSYGNIPKTVTYQGTTYAVTELYGCFFNCIYLQTAPTISADVTNMYQCFGGCSSLTQAPAIPATVTNMGKCFYECSALQTAPVIPNSVTNMSSCFMRCISLVNAPTIPNGVTDMYRCFEECESLVTAPVIPASVTDIIECFKLCAHLQGEVVINANAGRFQQVFFATWEGIWLTGSSALLQLYADTASSDNVFVGEIPLSGSLAAERVSADGGTTPDPEGQWLHLILSISWSRFDANSIDTMQVDDNGSYTQTTWYTDASKTSAITLPDWRPAATAEAHTWLHIDGDTHTIQVNLADAYHTGEPVVITIPQVFRTIDFLAGGKGIAFGKVAEHEGFECAMDVFIQPWAGVIQMYAGSTAPSGWLLCDGSEVAVADYPLLHAVIGNTYGTPSDSDHFLLPDLGGRFPIGANTPYPIGDTGGSADAIVPYHRHSVSAVSSAITGGSHNHEIKYNTVTRTSGGASTRVGPYSYTNTSYDGVYNKPSEHTHNLPAHNTNYVGTSGEEVGANIPPYLGINFIICTGETS